MKINKSGVQEIIKQDPRLCWTCRMMIRNELNGVGGFNKVEKLQRLEELE